MKLQKTYDSILIIPDLHCPFHHKDSFSFLKKLKEKYRPELIINLGDEIDYHAISYHEHNPDLPSAGEELQLARKAMKQLEKIFPKMILLDSNHGSLVYRKTFSAGMSKEFLKSPNEILKVGSGWEWSHDLRFKTANGEWYACHGKSGKAKALSSQYGMSTIQGHFHESAQISMISTPHALLYDIHAGCLIDKESLAFAYNKINVRRPILSACVIVNGVPQLIPMQLNKNGRWNGRI